MNSDLLLYGAPLIVAALALLVVPMLRYRSQPTVLITTILLIVVFPLAVALIYSRTTSVDWEQQALAEQRATAPAAEVDNTIRQLAERMQTNPDPEGWVLLGRSYATLGRYQEAADAMYEAWYMTEGRDVDININYAEALILADQRTLRTSAADLLDQAYQVRPNDPRVLWYGGLSAAVRGQVDAATERWTRLLSAPNLPDDMRQVVQQQLASLGAAAAPAEPAAPAPAGEVTTATVTIDVAPELQDQIVANEPL